MIITLVLLEFRLCIIWNCFLIFGSNILDDSRVIKLDVEIYVSDQKSERHEIKLAVVDNQDPG